MLKFLRPLAALALSAVAPVHGADRLTVASLNTVMTDIARNVGGDNVEITAIVKPGVDPHDFEPSPGDIKKISNSQIVLASGLGFETYLDKLRQSVGTKPTFVIAGDAIKPIMGFDECDHDHSAAGDEHGDSANTPDPHWFHSIRNAEIVTNQIRDAFSNADPGNKTAYFSNAAAYQSRLDSLAKWVRVELAKLPKTRRVLVTSHDALGYFARDNGFRVLPVAGFSSSDQPSSQRVTDLIQEIRDAKVKAIFAESIENPKILVEITKETGAKLGGAIYADGLGDKEATTFDSMMRYNVSTIVQGLE